ncbi:MAG TPA: amidohydrolase [Pyrinomonadaceae bacterium]|nr:amidohydrolase [Pyrinomonadaceae bacterium]
MRFLTQKITTASLFLILAISFSSNAQSTRAAERFDTLIIGGTIVTMDPTRRIIDDGAIGVRNGLIVFIGNKKQLPERIYSRQTVRADGKVIIPGLINGHTHIPMTLLRGLADDLDLQEWLTKYIFPAEAKNVNEEFVRAGTRLGIAELIRGGTTLFCDMYYFEDAIAQESRRAGIRAVLGETLIDFPAPDNKTFSEALKYTESFINKWKRDSLIIPAVAPHAPYTVSAEHLLLARDLSMKYKVPLVIHLAEAESETKYVMEKYNGLRPIEFLESIGFFTDKTIAAHVIQAKENELEILKRRNVGVVHNPQSNMKLAAGVAPVPAMLRLKMRLGLGTDGAASNNDLNLWEEMDTAAKLHKVFSRDPKAVSAEEAFSMATIDGARALHLEDKTGSLEVGKYADLVLVDISGLHQTPLFNLYSQLVYATKASDVTSVMIGGRWVMFNRRLLTLNENAIKKEAILFKNKIRKSLSN